MKTSGLKIAAMSVAALHTLAVGQVVTLADNGSVAQISAAAGGGPSGLFNWTAGAGPNEVVRQSYYIRVGTGPIVDVAALSAPTISQPTAYLANIQYTNSSFANFDISFRYLLTGGFPDGADLSEVTSVINRGTGPLQFSLYEFDYFAPGGTPGGTATLQNSSTIRQTNNGRSVTVGATGIPNHWMIGHVGDVQNAVNAGNLLDSSSPFTAGDVAFGFQWDVNLAAAHTWQMSKDKILAAVPEPCSLVICGLALALVRRRKS